MKRAVAILVALTLYAGAASTAGSAAPAYPLHAGQHGQRVADLQWLLGGHKPSVYRLSTFKWKPNGSFGARTKSAVVRMKWRLGWPTTALKPVADRPFLEILQGKRARPTAYITRAAARAKTLPAPVEPWARKLVAIEAREHAAGVREIPLGSNAGARVLTYQSSTGAYRAAWCVSFQQWARLEAGFSTIANRSANVFYVVEWGKRHGIAYATPRVGDLVAFMDGLGHIGLVARVVKGGFYSYEGNASDRVRFNYHAAGARPTVFVRASNLAPSS